MARSDRPSTQVAVGEVLHRLHAANRAARHYGRLDGTWRWDDPEHRYGALYVGMTQEGPFAETILRRPRQTDIVWSEVEKRRWATFRVTEPLHLADMHGKGISWQGVTVAVIAADHDGKAYPGTYAETQAISAEVHATTDLDGIAYRSRFEPDQLCIALFDRADHKIEVIQEGDPIDRGWVEALLQSHGKQVIDV